MVGVMWERVCSVCDCGGELMPASDLGLPRWRPGGGPLGCEAVRPGRL